MKFGLFYEWPNPGLRDWRRLFEEGIEQIQYSEEMGFDFVLIAEHHFTNYGMSPAPLLQALHIAEKTKRLKIATAVLVLPIWQPLRLAEEVAVLDNLSDGRFVCGVGRGYQPHEFARFDIPLNESRIRFSETLDVMVKAWTSDDSFTYDGQFVKVVNETVVWPKPLQKPYPPLWIAGTSPDTVRIAAEWGMAPITTGIAGLDAVRETAASWVQARRELGKPIDGLDLGVQCLSLVANSDAEARAQSVHARWQNRAGRALNRLAVEHGRVKPGPYEGEVDDDVFWDRLFYGDPDRVTQKFRNLAECGATFASTWMMLGEIKHETVMRSIRLMGDHVIPALKDVQPPADLLPRLAMTQADHDVLRSIPLAPSD